MADGASMGHGQPLLPKGRMEPFGFECSRCRNCCHDKRIQVNPYEVARLAKNRGLTAAEFRKRFTVDGQGTVLTQTEDGACSFLGAEGCSVHADRPLVCRLYPLGRHIGSDGSERFSRVEPHPLSRGTFHTRGTVADFLDAQGAWPFMHAADAYFAWFCRADRELGSREEDAGSAEDVGTLLDLDEAVARACASSGTAEPEDIEARLILHLKILDEFLDEAKENGT